MSLKYNSFYYFKTTLAKYMSLTLTLKRIYNSIQLEWQNVDGERKREKEKGGGGDRREE